MKETVRTIVQGGQEALSGAGINDAAFDSKALLSFVLGIPFSKLFLHYDDEVEDEIQIEFGELLRERSSGVPLQYITGEQEFMGLSFHVDSRVLIPRLDTEILAEEAVKYINTYINEESFKEQGRQFDALDLCCGSGAIGLSIAKLAGIDGGNLAPGKCGDVKPASHETRALHVTLTDVSRDALDVAEENARALGVSDKVTFRQGDLLDALRVDNAECIGNVPDTGGTECIGNAPSTSDAPGKRFDLIVSNPPYIESDVIGTLDTEVKDHEPMLALDGGKDGLDIYRRIAVEAPDHLCAGGCLMMEIGANQGEPVKALLAEERRFCDIKVKKDLAGLDRVVIAKVQ